jgi:hypothetical protein
MNLNLIIFSNSEYSYLWPVIEESIINLFELNPIFVCDYTEMKMPNGFCNYLFYDKSDCYAQRWLKILPKIESKYIIVVHDVNIIVNCEIEKMLKLLLLIENNKIDRCSLNVFENNSYISNEENLQICDLNSNATKGKTFIPYDCCSSIWKKESFFNLWCNFPNESYRNSELNQTLQNFCKINFKCFGLNVNNEKIYYCLGRPYYSLFKILHITIKGKLVFPKKVYMDMENDFDKIVEKHSLLNKIEIDNSYEWLV